MKQQRRYDSVLREAIHLLGGESRLAAFLQVETDELRRWLRLGEIPRDAFVQTLDVLADGPYAAGIGAQVPQG